MKRGGLGAGVILVLAMAYLMAEPGQAITCGDVDGCLTPCITYLTGLQPTPAAACCDGVRRLKSMAGTTPDRRFACDCVKQAAAHFQNIKDSAVSALPAQCSCPLPFPIDLNYDCTKIP